MRQGNYFHTHFQCYCLYVSGAELDHKKVRNIDKYIVLHLLNPIANYEIVVRDMTKMKVIWGRLI